MKKTFKFFAAALAIVAAASCAKEINVDTPVDTPVDNSAEKVYMTFTASYETEGETKTVLADGNMVHWSDTDAIRIFGKKDGDSDLYISDDTFAIDPLSNDENPTFAVFTGTGVPYAKNYAVLPANGWTIYGSSYMSFSEGLGHQTAFKNSFDPSKHIAISSEATDTHFSFYNECALLKVKIGSDGIYSVKVDGKTGKKTYGVDNATIGMMLQYTPGKKGELSVNHVAGLSQSIILANSDPSKALESGETYYIVVPYGDFGDFKVTICDIDGNELASKSKASRFNIERNKVYDLGTFEKPVYQLQVGDYYYADGTTGTEPKSNVVGVVFYVGDPTKQDPTLKQHYPTCTHGVVVGLNQDAMSVSAKEAWTPYFGENDVNGITFDNGWKRLEPAASEMTGYGNTNVLSYNDPSSEAYAYCSGFSVPANASKWYIPTLAEFDVMYANKEIINNAIANVSGTILSGDNYATTSQEQDDKSCVAKYKFSSGGFSYTSKTNTSNIIRPIFAF